MKKKMFGHISDHFSRIGCQIGTIDGVSIIEAL